MSREPDPGEVLSVVAFTRRIKALLESNFPRCAIRGEVSNLRRQSSGHHYFTLKDARSQVPCVMFRGDALRYGEILQEGSEIIVEGEVSVYEPRGTHQIIVRRALEAGAGRLQAAFERLKQKLGAEGLFDPERKKALPALAQTVAIVTSPSGAAIQDFLQILERRTWQGRVIIVPAQVQGPNAARSIVAGIDTAEALGVDLLVVGRGGGSLEDLWCFNEESVARRVAACRVPVISAVGHEIDFTLSDFAADARAETPSAAAELISSGYLQQRERLERLSGALTRVLRNALQAARQREQMLAQRLRACHPRRLVEFRSLRLDELHNRQIRAASNFFFAREKQLGALQQRLAEQAPSGKVRLWRERLANLEQRLQRQAQRLVYEQRQHLRSLESRLDQASLQRVLDRGFAVVRDSSGQLVTRKTGLQPGDHLALDFADGEASVKVREV